MTFNDDTLAIARCLGRLLAEGSADLDSEGLQVALVARQATYELVQMLHRDIMGPRLRQSGLTIAELEANPVIALGRRIAQQPRIEPRVSPTDALSARHTGAAAAWTAVARSAITANGGWPSGHGAALNPDQAWTVIADSAAMAEAITILDDDLSASAEKLREHELAARLTQAHQSGIWVAAAGMRWQASAGTLPDVPLAAARPRPARVVVVRDVGTAILAQDSLGRLLGRAQHVRPEHAVQIAVANARTAGALAGALRQSTGKGDSALAERVGRLVEPLTRAASRPGRVASVNAGDPRPLHQAAELARFAAGRPARLHAASFEELALWATHLASSTEALADRATLELDGQRWLVPDTRDDATTLWSQIESGLEAPVLQSGLREAARAASRLAAHQRHGEVLPYAARPRLTAYQCLASPLESRRPTRPRLPGRVQVRTRGR